MNLERKIVQIQNNKYDSGLLEYTKEFPQMYKEFLRRRKFGLSCKYVLDLTSNVFWHYINSMYFPLNWFPSLIDFSSILNTLRQTIQNLVTKSNCLNYSFLKKEIRSHEVDEAIRFLLSDPDNYNDSKKNMKLEDEKLDNVEAQTNDSEQLKLSSSIAPLQQTDNYSSRFSDVVFRQSIESLSHPFSDLDDGFINSENCKISDIISYLEVQLKCKRESINKAFDLLKDKIKEQQDNSNENQWNDQIHCPQISKDLKENYERYIKEQNPFLIHSYLPFSKDDAEIKLTTNQNIFFERK